MSPSLTIVVILALLVPLWVRLRRDFVSGLSYGIVILVAATHFLQIPTPGILPELTIHRLVFLSILAAWLLQRDRRPLAEAPLYRPILIWAGLAFISLLGAQDFASGVKRFLEFVFELFLFYLVLATTLHRHEDGIRLLRAAVIGVSIVAFLAVFEKYTAVNLVDHLVAVDPDARVRDVRSTYRHRILLGTGMAMGWPLAVALLRMQVRPSRRLVVGILVAAMLSACYFSRSRGPWLGAILAGGVIVWLGSPSVRKPVVLFAVLTGLVFLLRPGVWETMFGLASQTVDTDSFKGGTFRYRLELWLVAFDNIKDSPWRLLFGNGPAAGLHQSIGWDLSYRNRDQEIWSWDNDFAYALFQYGILGLAATLAVYGSVALRLFRDARRRTGVPRDVYACLCASTLVLFFMMSNVTVFARQLHYLFWTITAVGLVAFAADPPEDEEPTFPTGDQEATATEVPESAWSDQPEQPMPR